jgi:hypothetical protein
VFAAASNNEILAVMFFALMVGIGLVLTNTDNTGTFKRAIEGLFEISMTLIGLVIRLAPYAVFCFMFNLAALFGWELLYRSAPTSAWWCWRWRCTCSWCIRRWCVWPAGRRARSSGRCRK